MKTINLDREVALLAQRTVGELLDRYAEVFGEPVRSPHKQYLIRRIAWRLQANAEGGLSERALRRAEKLANDAGVRFSAIIWTVVIAPGVARHAPQISPTGKI